MAILKRLSHICNRCNNDISDCILNAKTYVGYRCSFCGKLYSYHVLHRDDRSCYPFYAYFLVNTPLFEVNDFRPRLLEELKNNHVEKKHRSKITTLEELFVALKAARSDAALNGKLELFEAAYRLLLSDRFDIDYNVVWRYLGIQDITKEMLKKLAAKLKKIRNERRKRLRENTRYYGFHKDRILLPEFKPLYAIAERLIREKTELKEALEGKKSGKEKGSVYSV